MALKKGYKQTEVGIIPEEWKVDVLSSVLSYGPKNGYSGPSSKDSQGTPTLTLSATTSGKMILNEKTVKRLDELLLSTSDLFLQSGDVLVQRSNTSEFVGTTAVFDGPSREYIYPDLMMRMRFSNRVTADWFWRYANSNQGRQYFVRVAAGSTGTMPKLSGDSLRRMPIPLPPYAEQEAIAGALSDADAWIESLEQLIAKKRQIKQGAMQELLTGKRRLPGFSGEWETKRLGDIGSFLKGSGIRKNEANSGEIPSVRYGEIYTHHNDFIRRFYSSVSRDVANTSTRLDYGDLLFAGSGETKADIGKCVAYAHQTEAYAGGDIVILRSKKIDPIFMGYYCNTKFVTQQKAARGQGDAVVHISSTALANLEICTPFVQEQTAISNVLIDMDTEIESLESKLAKAREIKQGMMQELLTGRIRLI